MTATMPNMANIESIAGKVQVVDETLLRFLPYISTILTVIPQTAPIGAAMGGVTLLLQAVDNAAKAVAQGDPAAGVQTIFETVINHLDQAKPNSPILSPAA